MRDTSSATGVGWVETRAPLCALESGDLIHTNQAGGMFGTNAKETARTSLKRISDSGWRKVAPNTTISPKIAVTPSVGGPRQRTPLSDIPNVAELEPSTEGNELEVRPSGVLNLPHAAQPTQEHPADMTTIAPKPDEPEIPDGHIPSRKRDRQTLLGRAASRDQPPGAALPNLVPTNFLSIFGHLRIAEDTDPHNYCLEKAVTPEHQDMARTLVTTPRQVSTDRTTKLHEIRRMDAKLNDAKMRRGNALPTDTPSKGINFALMHHIAQKLKLRR